MTGIDFIILTQFQLINPTYAPHRLSIEERMGAKKLRIELERRIERVTAELTGLLRILADLREKIECVMGELTGLLRFLANFRRVPVPRIPRSGKGARGLEKDVNLTLVHGGKKGGDLEEDWE